MNNRPTAEAKGAEVERGDQGNEQDRLHFFPPLEKRAIHQDKLANLAGSIKFDMGDVMANA